jgi:hypothetical protein
VVTVKLLLLCIVFCSTNGLVVGGPDGFNHRFGGIGARLIKNEQHENENVLKKSLKQFLWPQFEMKIKVNAAVKIKLHIFVPSRLLVPAGER